MMSEFQIIKANNFTKAGFWTALVAGICCFTPLLVWTLAFAGLAAYTAYIDYVILPLFFIGVAVFLYGYRRYKLLKKK